MYDDENVPLRFRFMSESEQRRIKANVLLDFTETNAQIAALRVELVEYGGRLHRIASFLREGNAQKYLYELSFPEKKDIDDTAKSLEAAELKARQLREQLSNLGGIPTSV